MQYDPKKTGDIKNSEFIMMDQIYIDRFRNIVQNK